MRLHGVIMYIVTYVLAYRDQLEVVRQREDAEQLQLRHGRTQVLVVRRHRAVGHVVMRGDTAELRALEAASGTFVFDEVTLLKECSRRMDDISTLLHQGRVVLQIVDTNAVQYRVLEHADVPRQVQA